MFNRIPTDVILNSRNLLASAIFVETGTYHAEGAIWASGHFGQVVTIEIDRGLWNSCQDRLPANVTSLWGDSARVLQEVLESNPRTSYILWLDAHWCGNGTGSGATECPLLAELKSLSKHSAPWIAIIDDARYFLSSPPRPHKPEDWPSLDDIVRIVPHSGAIGGRDDFLVVCSHQEHASRLFRETAVKTINKTDINEI